MNDQLVVIANEAGLAEAKIKTLLQSFGEHFRSAQQIATDSKSIVVDDESQTDLMNQARSKRLALKNIRIEVERTRKELKEQSLREGKAIDGIANVIKALIVPVEEHLEKQEKFAEIREQQRLAKRYQNRVEQLSKYVDDISLYQLKEMSDEAFEKLLSDCRSAHQARIEAEKKVEAERLAKEKAEVAERERIRLENEKLRKQLEEKEKLAAEQRAKQEKELAKEREIAQKKLDAERKQKEALEAKILAEKKEREQKQAEEAAHIEAEKKSKEEAERAKLLAPDKQKLMELADLVESISLPAVQSNDAQSVIRATDQMLLKVATYIRDKARSL